MILRRLSAGTFACLLLTFAVYFPGSCYALVYPDIELKIFQFPSDMIPRIDGDPSDWNIVPDEYFYGTDMLLDVERDKPEGPMRLTKIDPKDLDIKVCIGWVKGMNCIYFLYEAYDNYWEFDNDDLLNDVFEICVDGDLSGGDFIFRVFDESGPGLNIAAEGSHAQNYHICTPAVNKSWAMAWNCPPWVNKLPFMNCAYSYKFKQGESGKLILEGWITPFDYISFDCPEKSTMSKLKENKIIGLAWLTADRDGPEEKLALASLSNDVMMVHDGDYLRPFKLMPLENKFIKEPVKAYYTFEVSKSGDGRVMFTDQSYGEITKWKWTFGDGSTSEERNPVHVYQNQGGYYGLYFVTLEVEGPKGKSKYTTLGEITIK